MFLHLSFEQIKEMFSHHGTVLSDEENDLIDQHVDVLSLRTIVVEVAIEYSS